VEETPAYRQQAMVRYAGMLLSALLSGSLMVGCAATKPQVDPFRQQSIDAGNAGIPSASATAAPADTGVHRAAFTQPAPAIPALEPIPRPSAEPTTGSQRPLQIPSDLPGSEAPPIRLPAVDPRQPQPERIAEIERLFRALPELPGAMRPAEGAPPLSLAELQDIALRQNPVVRQAMADVQAARGAAIQAGALPNPSIAFQEDNVNTGGTAGYQGVGISQTIPTGGKLALARKAANVDVQNAELTLCRTRNEVITQVRSNYYAVLVAKERIKVNRALSEFAEKVYRAQIGRTKTGQAAPYEPLQLRVLVLQARAQLIQSQNEYGAAWRRLAATLSAPEMPPVEVVGDVNISVPSLDQQAAWRWICDHHTDLIIAQNGVVKSRRLLQLAKIAPWVPDINVDASIQHDNTVAPFGTAYNLHAGIPIPLFDRNRGNIMSADAALMRASQEYNRTRNELAASLADAFARYQSQRVLLDYYRTQILQDQVQSYRAIYQRYQQDTDSVEFNDVVTSQQTLASAVSTYIQALGDQWESMVEMAGLLQLDDLSQLDQFAAARDAIVLVSPARLLLEGQR
jgi:cobalt-zinc-cadmium efflux system outer membrane protein